MKEDINNFHAHKWYISQIIGVNSPNNLENNSLYVNPKEPTPKLSANFDNNSKQINSSIPMNISGLPKENSNPLDNLIKNRYSPSNQGPFYVYVQSQVSLPSSIHPLYIGRTLSKMKFKDVIKVKKLGFSKQSGWKTVIWQIFWLHNSSKP